MLFEWDEAKEKENIRKHGLDFETAARVFGDANRVELYDVAHSAAEDRFITIGLLGGTVCVVFVVYSERGEAIRLISPRRATKQERKWYYDYAQRNSPR